MIRTLSARWSLILIAIAVILYGFFFVYASSTYLDLKTQMFLGWGVILVLLILKGNLFPNKDIQRIILLLLGLFLTTRYWFFRTFDTLYYTGFWGFLAMTALYLAESYCILMHVLGMFVNIFPMRREISPANLDDPNLPSVDVFIPTYDEPEEIVNITVTACDQIDYPKDKLNIFILDDGSTLEKRGDPDQEKARQAQERYERLKSLARSLGVNYLTRERNIHAKAGNISHALSCTCPEQSSSSDNDPGSDSGFRKSCGDLILILDCDHVPTRDILKNLVGFFMQDDDLFLVQTPHFFINPDPVEKNLGTFLENPSENEMFYRSVQVGLDLWNSSFFCGSAGILRRQHLAEIGGLACDTITEDAETSLTLHGRGYKSVYVSTPMVCGLSPETFDDFISQRTRWAQGMTQLLVLKNPLFLKKLKFYQKISYFNSCFFWFFGLARLIFVVAPLTYLIFGLKVYNASLLQILAFAIPHIFGVYVLTNHMFGDVRHPFFSELYETAQSFFNIPAVLKAVFRPRSPRFKVTPKSKTLRTDFLSPLAAPFYFLSILAIGAVPMAIMRWLWYPLEHDAIIICSFWSGFNLVLMLLCLGIVWERRQIRRQHRIYTEEEITIQIPETGDKYICKTSDLSLDGVRLIVKPDTPVSEGDRIGLLVQDSYGNKYTIPAEVIRADSNKKGMICGCEFLVDDEQTRRDIINYVYGDSGRWDKCWRRSRRRISTWRGLVYLFLKGIDGSTRNIIGIFSLAVSAIQRYMEVSWKKSNLGT